MARQVLENGVILPAEYSDDWYDDMTSNLTKLDDVIGSDSEKLSSSDVGAAALSNNYNDLDNLPTIPTVNDATLTIQKNGVDVQTFTANASSNVTANITVPTKTSDITNDSNFVDTSNPAVASGITSAKVTSYDAHIADTDIHVTTADKNKWNNQTYVFRYSSTALVASSTNSNALLDNTDNLKVGDKVIDSSGVLFSITAIDTANSTFTIGTALIDLAQDSDVVHKSGNETISGNKSFSETPYIYNYNSTGNAPNIVFKNSKYAVGDTTNTGEQRIIYSDKNNTWAGSISSNKNIAGSQYLAFTLYTTDNNNASISSTINYYLAKNGDRFFTPYEDNLINLGTTQRRWKNICATNYYYGSNNVEFSTKFVTTDTNQTISGTKTFSSNVNVYNSDNSSDIANLILKNQKAEKGGSLTDSQIIYFVDKLIRSLATIRTQVGTGGQSILQLRADNTDSNNNAVYSGFSINSYKDGTKNILPNTNGDTDFGTATIKWKSFNGLEPSALSLPSDRSARIDISSYFSNTGTGNINSYTVPANGYIFLRFTSITGAICYSQTSGGLTNYAQTFPRQGDGLLYVFFPVRKDDNFVVQIYTSSTAVVESAFFIPCQGNV